MARYTTSTTLVSLFLGLYLPVCHAQLQQAYCSRQNTGSDNQQGESPLPSSIFQSNGLCFDACKQSYAFAVVQNQACWCSNYAPSDQQDTTQCGVDCPGFPKEKCGNQDQGLYGYIALSKAPSGTAAPPSASTPSTSTKAPAGRPGPPPPPSSSPTTSDAPATIEASLSPTTNNDPAPSPVTVTVEHSVSLAPSTVSSPEPTPSSTTTTTPTTTSSTTTDASTESPTPITNTQVVTVSGAIVTQTVTSTPRARPTSGATAQQPVQSKSNAGVIAGAVVGSIAGIALLLLAFFFFWRRRRAASTAGSTQSGRMRRNASVLSRAGLLTARNNQDPEKSMDEPRFGSQRQSALYDSPESPISAPSGVHEPGQLSRRNSRPLVYDQRLNPAALMENWQLNGSRTSVGTMQDQRDYSRPLGIANPD